MLDGVLAQSKLLGDITVRRALDNRGKDLALPWRKTEVFPLLFASKCKVTNVLQQVGHTFMSHPELTRHHRANAFSHQLRRRVFQHDATRTEFDCLNNLPFLNGYTEDYRADGTRGVGQLSQNFQARPLGHSQVEQQNVGTQLPHQADHLNAVRGFPDYLHIRLGLDQSPEAEAKNRMIVGDQDAYGVSLANSLSHWVGRSPAVRRAPALIRWRILH